MYARMVTSHVRPNKLNELTTIYQETLLPLIEHQPGCSGIFVFNNPDEDKEISITLWERLVDMEAFNVNLLVLKDRIAPLLVEAPEVEIFQVAIPRDVEPLSHVPLSETSLGIRIEDPFSRPLG